MTTLRLVLAGLLAAVGLVALTPTASYACSCAVAPTKAHVRYADAIFVGTLVGMEPPPRRQIMASTDPNTYTFNVQQVLEGAVGSTAEVESAMSGASCGWEGMEIGTRYVVFATAGRQTLRGNLCDGTRGASDQLVAEIAEMTGAQPQPLPPELGILVAPVRVGFRLLY